MRKLAIMLLFCFIVVGCKKNEPAEIVVQNTDGTTSPLPPPETATPVTTASVATAATEPPATTATTTTSSAATAATGSTATKVSNDAPWGEPPKPVEPDMIVDTFYIWPERWIPDIKRLHPQLVHFNSVKAKEWQAKRKRQGWREVARINVPGRPEPLPPDPTKRQPKKPYELFIDFARVMIVYERP